MVASPLRWILVEPDPRAVTALVDTLGLDPLLARLLVNRGHATPEAAQAFLAPSLRDLPDPMTMADAQTGADCIAQVIQRGGRICIYGDYDVDGISASALLHEFFLLLGVETRVFLPDRFRDGYGLNGDRLRELADEGVDLFIAVDCGSRSVDEIAAVRARGIEFVVCDHHALGPEHPPATAFLNPHRLDCRYPDKHLSAVGVALVLAQATRRALQLRGTNTERIDLKGLLEFAALGTIADMVQLRGVNRILSWHGLRLLGTSTRPGIQALAAQAGPREGARADRVGFDLGPRINAAGRVADAHTAFRLLTTRLTDEATTLAARIEVENNQRRTLQAHVVQAALLRAETQVGREDAIVVADVDWHQGVVGIAASKLKDALGVPVFVLAVDPDGMARGSGRSVVGYDLVEGLRACCGDGLAERYGGHAFAAGVTIRADRIEAFRERLCRHVAEVLPADQRGEVVPIDAPVVPGEVSVQTVDQIEQLEPFGKGNRRPHFLLRDVQVAEFQIVGKQRDWVRGKVVVAAGRQALWARETLPFFGPLRVLEGLQRGDRFDGVIKLERNSFQGKSTLQATVEAVLPPGTPIDTQSASPK